MNSNPSINILTNRKYADQPDKCDSMDVVGWNGIAKLSEKTTRDANVFTVSMKNTFIWNNQSDMRHQSSCNRNRQAQPDIVQNIN